MQTNSSAASVAVSTDHGQLVMVVDDDIQDGDMLVNCLKHLGHRTILVRKGQEAMSLIVLLIKSGQEIPAVVITDPLMQGETGLYLARELLALKFKPEDPAWHPKIILTSRFIDSVKMAELTQISELSLPKPFSFDTLKALLEA